MSALPFNEAAERVKASLDIVDVVQRYVILKKSGRSYLGKCPFHNDKNPSMNVNREKRMFKCFACGEGGDALSFLMKIEHKTYPEIIRDLAAEHGIEIIRDGQSAEVAAQQRDFKQKLRDINAAAARWFADQLQTPVGETVRAYLTRRQTEAETIARFGLGYAPDGWENLSPVLKRQFDFVQANPDLLVEAGLAGRRDHGQGHYDRFRNRLIIPIHDEKGQVVAFGGRALSDEDKPKYLNSPETPIYHKSQVLYGMHLAKEAIRERKQAVVMEGYFDVIAAHTAGITEAVGSCGTALTDQHLKLLTRFGAETVYLAFDSDEAGLKAALSAIALIEPYLDSTELKVKVLTVPDGKDPDDFVRTYGTEAGPRLREMMIHARDFLAFKFDMAIRELDVSTPEGRIDAANRLTPLLAALNRPTLRSEYLRRYAERIGISEEALQLEVKRYEQARMPAVIRPASGFYKAENKKAISKHPWSSLKRNQPRLTDNLAQMREALGNRQDVLEKNLLRLLFYNTESYQTMLAYLQSKPELCLITPENQQLLATARELAAKIDPMADDPLGTLIEKMNHVLVEQPPVLHTLADVVMSAETFGDSLGLGELHGTSLREKLATLADTHLTQLEECRRKIRLQAMLSQEGDDIERQYQLREQLLATRQQPEV